MEKKNNNNSVVYLCTEEKQNITVQFLQFSFLFSVTKVVQFFFFFYKIKDFAKMKTRENFARPKSCFHPKVPGTLSTRNYFS